MQQEIASPTSSNQKMKTIGMSVGWVIMIFLSLTSLKILLIPSYFSTDFEVHRNWMAITNSLPLSKWYHDTNSDNATLDYPPFFALFEKLISYLGCNSFWGKLETSYSNITTENSQPIWCDVVKGVNYQSYPLLLFQRLTVIFISDVIYFIACLLWVKNNDSNSIEKNLQLGLLYICPGLLFIDNIHFQYNGILFGILLLSLVELKKGNYIRCGILYSILLNMKHLNLYMAPAYFFFLLFDFCLADGKFTSFIKRILGLGISVVSVFMISFLPFLLSSSSQFDNKIEGVKSEFQQIMSRLFPFERGLTHAYWAPNFWALYNTLDKLLTVVLGKVFKVVNIDGKTASLTGGLVGLNQGSHAILPSITPLITIILCLGVSFSVCFYLIVLSNKTKRKGVQTILLAIVHSVYAFYMFGWHIHEKAVLSILIPLAVLVTCFSSSTELSRQWFRVFSFTSIVGTFSLFPLLFHTKEIPIRWAVLVSFVLFLRHVWYSTPEFCTSERLFSTFERLFLYGLVLIEIYQVFIHQFIFSDRLPFLPLMIISFYCAVGLHYSWIKTFSISTFSIKEKSN